MSVSLLNFTFNITLHRFLEEKKKDLNINYQTIMFYSLINKLQYPFNLHEL